MKNNELPSNWTDKQRKAYEMLMASVIEQEQRRMNAPSLMNKAPKGGWTDADRVK